LWLVLIWGHSTHHYVSSLMAVRQMIHMRNAKSCWRYLQTFTKDKFTNWSGAYMTYNQLKNSFNKKKILDLQHQYNNCTITLHMKVGLIYWGSPLCERLLCSCCDSVVQELNPLPSHRPFSPLAGKECVPSWIQWYPFFPIPHVSSGFNNWSGTLL